MGDNYWEFRAAFNEGHHFSNDDSPIGYREMYQLFKISRGNIVDACLEYALSEHLLRETFPTAKRIPPQLIVDATINRGNYARMFEQNPKSPAPA
ncbi:MAG: hypothetical protein ACP5NS_02415 [Candidatus Pacearchaeota archaeon]